MSDHQTRAVTRQPEKLTMTVTQAAIALGISRTTASAKGAAHLPLLTGHNIPTG